ncbi:MAG: EAL domain-containing protein [Lachnospiraceae bacterium]|nr:EAL domain-containing protein [Lachnospiraceae bacterium]
MNIEDLIGTYSYAGDVAAVITCFVLLVIIRQALFFTTENDFKQVAKAIRLVMVAALANIAFALVITYTPQLTVLLYLYRDIYHAFLLWALYLFTMYLTRLVGFPENKYKMLINVVGAVVNLGIFADILSPITKVGFYEENGLWYDSTYIKPFTVTYIFCMLAMAYMLLAYRKRLIRQLRVTFIAMEAIMALVMILENTQDSNTYTTFTFVVPIITILILVHSKPFDLLTGSMDQVAFASFIEHVNRRKLSVDYIILEIKLEGMKELPEGLGRVLFTTWQTHFRKAMLFNLEKGVYVLALSQKDSIESMRENIYTLIQEELPVHYRAYMLDYKMLALQNIDFIKGVEQMKDLVSFALMKMDYNTSRISTEDEIYRYSKMEYIGEQLQDIYEKGDLNDNRVKVYCQPVKNVKQDVFDTAEALMRIELDEYGMIYPDVFIPIAERRMVIHGLSKIILNKTCAAIHQIMEDGFEIERVSVNFAVEELRDPQFCSEVVDIIKQNNISVEKLAIELTETQNDSDYEMVRDRINELRRHGIKFYLDDFGTGYSNFDRVMKLGMDVVKFDRSLLLYSVEDDRARYTMKHFSQSLKGLNYKILFEGVENEEHEMLCDECGADYLQGFKYSRPIPIEDLEEFLEYND